MNPNPPGQMDLFELTVRILCDTRPPGAADGVFLCCQTRDNQDSALDEAVELLRGGFVPRLLMLDSKPKSGYPGYRSWREALLERGVDAEAIEGVPLDDVPMLNTLVESEATVAFAKARGYRTLYVVSAPFHLPRAFMTLATVALRRYPELRIHARPGRTLPWGEQAVHSQGSLSDARSGLIRSEGERIHKYHEKGDLGSPEDILAYLDRRDDV